MARIVPSSRLNCFILLSAVGDSNFLLIRILVAALQDNLLISIFLL